MTSDEFPPVILSQPALSEVDWEGSLTFASVREMDGQALRLRICVYNKKKTAKKAKYLQTLRCLLFSFAWETCAVPSPLVPKLCLGTRLSRQLCWPIPPAKQSFVDKCVPKLCLGTRGVDGSHPVSLIPGDLASGRGMNEDAG